MTAPTLTEFLLARIAEDEEGAQAALNGGNGAWESGADNYNECRVEGQWIVIYDEGGHTPEQARHIARHDPARVLAECEAKRRIVTRAEWVLANPTKVSHDAFCHAKADLFDLAAIYSDHADYRWGGVVVITQASVDAALRILGQD